MSNMNRFEQLADAEEDNEVEDMEEHLI